MNLAPHQLGGGLGYFQLGGWLFPGFLKVQPDLDFPVAVICHQLRPFVGGNFGLGLVRLGSGLFRTAYLLADFRVIPFGIRKLQPGFTHGKHLALSWFCVLLYVGWLCGHKPIQLCILRELIYEWDDGIPIEQQSLAGIGVGHIG